MTTLDLSPAKASAAGRAALLSRWFLALLFLYASIDKAFHYEGFLRAVTSYALVPPGAVRYVGMVVVLLELATGVGLLTKRWRTGAALMSVVLLLIFSVALAITRHFHPAALCGCWFTLTLARGTGQHIAQNLLMAALALAVLLKEAGRATPADPG